METAEFIRPYFLLFWISIFRLWKIYLIQSINTHLAAEKLSFIFRARQKQFMSQPVSPPFDSCLNSGLNDDEEAQSSRCRAANNSAPTAASAISKSHGPHSISHTGFVQQLNVGLPSDVPGRGRGRENPGRRRGRYRWTTDSKKRPKLEGKRPVIFLHAPCKRVATIQPGK